MRCRAGFIFLSFLAISSCKGRGFNEQANKALSDRESASQDREGHEDGALHKSRFQEVFHKETKKFFTLLDDLAKRLVTSQEPMQFKYGQTIRNQLKPPSDDPSKMVEGGAGAHGSAKPNAANHAFHALWSRFAEAAPTQGMIHAGHHMKHFLQNSGRDLVLSEDVVDELMKSFGMDAWAENPRQVDKDIETTIQSAKSRRIELRREDFLPLDASKQKIRLHLNKLELQLIMSQKVQKPAKGEPLTLAHYAPLKEYLASLISKDSKSVLLDRPSIRNQEGVSSPDASDWFYALGAFSLITRTVPLVQAVFEKSGNAPHSEGVILQYATVFSIYDRYNWDNGKSVYLFHAWCEKLKDIPCEHLQDVTRLELSDRLLGRLHTVGIAKEYDIWGYSKPFKESQSLIFSQVFAPENLKKMQLIRDFYRKQLGLPHKFGIEK
jgi:hypothetical protein